ncbi:hypothetical protein GUITHDRAFT_121913, partial [Guillardia theta CCMP2712]
QNFDKSRMLESMQQQNVDKMIQLEALAAENASLNSAYQGIVSKYDLIVKDHEKLLQDFVATKKSLTSEISMLLAYNEEMKKKLEPYRDHMRDIHPQLRSGRFFSILSLIPGTVAADCGMMHAGDIVFKVDGVEQDEVELDTLLQALEGAEGSEENSCSPAAAAADADAGHAGDGKANQRRGNAISHHTGSWDLTAIWGREVGRKGIYDDKNLKDSFVRKPTTCLRDSRWRMR